LADTRFSRESSTETNRPGWSDSRLRAPTGDRGHHRETRRSRLPARFPSRPGKFCYTRLMQHAPNHDEPWYKDGLKFTCTQCGNCCTGAPGVVWVDDGEIEKIADYLGKSTGEVRLFHTRPVRGRISLTEFA